jgi:hypothetical protein
MIQCVEHRERKRLDAIAGLLVPVSALRQLLSEKRMECWLALMESSWIIGKAAAPSQDGEDVSCRSYIAAESLIDDGGGLLESHAMAKMMGVGSKEFDGLALG